MEKNKYLNYKILLILIFFITIETFSQEINLIHNKNHNTLVEFNEIENYYGSFDKENIIKADINSYASTYGYLLLIKSTGKTRKIAPEKLNTLGLIFKSFSLSKNAESLFENEVLVTTDNGNFWFPIQKSLFEFWINEMQKESKALIYIRAYGAIKDVAENKWLFTINSFNSDYYDGLWEEALSSFNNNDENNGLSCLRKLIALDPNDGRNYSMYGYYYYDKGFPDNKKLLIKADSLYSLAEKFSPDFSYVYYQQALVKFQLGEFKKSWEAIEKARHLNETNIEDFFIKKLENKLPYSEYIMDKN